MNTRPGEDVGAMIGPVVAGHEGDLCPCGVQAEVPHDVTVSFFLATGYSWDSEDRGHHGPSLLVTLSYFLSPDNAGIKYSKT